VPLILTPLPATDYPVTWADAKRHLRLDGDGEAAYVTSLIAAATDYAESEMACTLTARNQTAVLYEAWGNPVGHPLPYGPLLSVQSVTDADDAAVSADGYVLTRVGHTDRIRFTGSPAYPVTVVYRAGYATAEQVPASVRTAILMHVATLYENRETVSETGRTPVPHTLEAFYRLKARTVGVC
jgi:uncharacterized phiE125 gp8 family phage protein